MISSSQPSGSITDVARQIQQQVDLVCLGAMEMQRDTPDPRAVASLLAALQSVSDAALRAGVLPILQASQIVREAITLAQTETSAPAPYLGHYVTSAAADLARVVNALILGNDPAPILAHARETIGSMPRSGSDYLVELDLTDPEQVARIFAAMADAPEPQEPATQSETPSGTGLLNPARGQQIGRLRELRQLLASYVARAEALRATPGRRETLDDLLIGAKSLRASAAAAGLRPVERLAARLAFIADAQISSGAPPTEDVVAFTLACGRAMAAAIDAPEVTEPAAQRLDDLIQQSSDILRRFRIDAGSLGTGMLPVITPGRSSDNGDSMPTAGQALATALLALTRNRHPDGAADPAPTAADAIVADPSALLADIGEVTPRLNELIRLWQRGAQPAAVSGMVRQTLLRLKESAAVAGAASLVDRCWRLEQRISSQLLGAQASQFLDDLQAFARDLAWILSQTQPSLERQGQGTDHRNERDGGTVRIAFESATQLVRLVDELAVRSGGYPQRSRRLSNTIQDIAIVKDRLRAFLGRLDSPNGGAALVRELSEIISDLGIATADLDQLLAESDALNQRSERVLLALRGTAQGLLLVPLESVTPTLSRAVEGLARQLGRRVAFSLDGGATPVPSMMLDRLTQVMLHLLRNAVEHGIEDPAARRARGKPAQGTVRVRAFRDGSQIVIEVSDDGRGIDDRLVTSLARTIGFPLPADGMSRERALQLIFLPGLTSRARTDGNGSGGHGLDAVSTAAAELQGAVTVQSDLGTGTTFVLRLPVLTAAVETVVVTVANQSYVLPFTQAEFLPAAAVRSVAAAGTGFLADLGGSRIPAADLGGLLGVRSPQHVQDAGGFWLRVQHDGSQWLIRVDSAPERQEIQLAPVSPTSPQLPSVVGMAQLPSSEAAVALDLAQLLDSRRRARRRRSRQTSTLHQMRVALVANASVSARRGLGQTLEQNGWRVVEARDGLEAWELLDSASPDLLVIDLDLPVLDAFNVIRAAKSQGDLPVIALAAEQDAATQAQVMAVGVDALLTKPVEPERLLASLKGLGHGATDSF